MANSDDRNTNNDILKKQLEELGRRSEKVGDSVKELLSQYQKMSMSDEQYQDLLKQFHLMGGSVGRPDKDSSEKRKHYRMVSMMYIVIHGFSKICESEDSEHELDKLEEIIFGIDRIRKRYHLTKFQTVGDNMLFAGGVEVENKTNPIDVTLAAFEIANYVNDLKEKEEFAWEFGIGVHTGPVTGSIKQEKKVPYMLSGNNVLIATRLGLLAQSGHVSISLMTYELIKEFFEVHPLNQIPVKFSGMMPVYDLLGILPEMCSLEADKLYNEKFDLAYSRLQFMDIQEFILDKLERELPKNLYYHSVKHTIDVTTECELIGWAEGLPESEVMLLKIAGLFHDSGHIKTYKGHEEESCNYVQEYLPQYNYSQEKIDKIKSIIMATKLPHTPNNILEAVIQDSDLDYLGRRDFVPVSNMLYRELKERNMADDLTKWNEGQIAFISGHQYYTNTAKTLREVNKQSQIEHIKELIADPEAAMRSIEI